MNMAEDPPNPSAIVRMLACLQPVFSELRYIKRQSNTKVRHVRARFCRTARIPGRVRRATDGLAWRCVGRAGIPFPLFKEPLEVFNASALDTFRGALVPNRQILYNMQCFPRGCYAPEKRTWTKMPYAVLEKEIERLDETQQNDVDEKRGGGICLE